MDPSITCQVIFTGEWSLAVKEAEATNALLLDNGDFLQGSALGDRHAQWPDPYRAGRDQIWGSYGRDTILGGDDDDAIYGNQDDDELWGENSQASQ